MYVSEAFEQFISIEMDIADTKEAYYETFQKADQMK